MAQRLRVLYIAGDGRSGSTLLERMLGQIDAFAAMGELRHIWKRGFAENQLCGCGSPFGECAFWSQVVKRGFSGEDAIDPAEALALQEDVEHTRHIPMMFLAPRASGAGQRREAYTALLMRLYRVIDELAGGRVIINSSKEPSSAYLLSRMPGVDVSVVQLVRDSRAVSFSWMRKKVRPEIVDKTVYMPTYRPGLAAFNWLFTRNLLSEASRLIARRYVRIRYEDLVCKPRQVIQRVLEAVGVDGDALDFIDGNTVRLDKVNHTVAGNPMRFERGAIKLKLDDEWRSGMRAQDRRLVTAVTWPLLLAYGYLGDRREPASRS